MELLWAMSLLALILFGIVQGITEFLPVSSSGHLTLMQYFSENIPESLSLNIAVHLGTLLTILVFYRRDLLALITGFFKGERDSLHMVGFIFAASLPTALIGLTFKKALPFLLTSPWLVGICLLLTGCVLITAKCAPVSSVQDGRLSYKKAIVLGFVQGIAVLPGLSRSGLTIVSALWLGVEREAAARFSFLISVPAILGAGLLEWVSGEESIAMTPLVTGAVVSFLVGLGAIYLVVWLTKNQRLSSFSYYLWAVGGLVLLQLLMSPAGS